MHYSFRQFKSPFTYLLLVAAALSGFVGDWLNAVIIVLIVIINGLLKLYQEYRAQQALKLLKVHLIMKAKVVRDGAESILPNTALVPGDLIRLQPGDYVPADVRFIEGAFSVDESILTGESTPVKKASTPLETKAQDVYQATNLGLLGTTVTGGSGKAVVLGTGSNTLFGSISQLSMHTISTSGFQIVLARLSSFILAIICITLVVLFLFQLIIKGTHADVIQLLLFSIAIALGITPEALPTVTTFALSRGALQLAHHNVIVKRLSAIEDLGAITILCTDKTGTLTENKLSVASLYNNDKQALIYLLLAAKKNNPQDPLDKALWMYASDEDKEKENQYKKIKEIPFDPAKRRNAVVVQQGSDTLLIVRGAYESIEQLCTSNEKGAISSWIEQEAQLGHRVLAVAYKKGSQDQEINDQGLTLVGLVAFEDPIKKTAIEAIAKAHKLGIKSQNDYRR